MYIKCSHILLEAEEIPFLAGIPLAVAKISLSCRKTFKKARHSDLSSIDNSRYTHLDNFGWILAATLD
jgi:hypothetical protein